MSLSTLGVDAYQLTTLVAHADAGRLEHRVTMSFFYRKLPRARNFVVFCGLRPVLEHAAQMRLEAAEIDALRAHPLLGPALAAHPAVVEALQKLDGFEGDIDAIPEGTLTYAAPGVRTDGSPLVVAGAPLQLYIPLMQVKTDMVRAKMLETPWLGFINHASMIASKAARVAIAAGGKTLFEFGARRTHPAAAVESAYAAYVGGTDATSNLAAFARYGVPAVGTMDHFAVQASERPGVAVEETERDFYAAFTRLFPNAATLLVDTYDTDRGLRDAVHATTGRVTGVRIDSNVTPQSIAHARALLDGLGAEHVKIYVSDGLDEHRVKELAGVADGFGVGENISCSPDAATGVGAVAKLVVNGYGKVTMKLARGTGKATLPGEIQAWRAGDHDIIALADEAGPPGATPLLEPVWRGREKVRALPNVTEVRAYAKRQIDALPAAARALEPAPEPRRKIVASDKLVALVEKLTKEAGL